jgi:uncharacterized membrane protein YczE
MDAPQAYKNAGIFMLVSGIMTCLLSMVWIFSLIWILVGCFWVLTLVVGIFEIVIGVAMLQGSYKPNAKTVQILGIVASFLCGDMIGVVMEVLALMQLNQTEVQEWMSQQDI